MEIQMWRDILNPYELAVNEILVKFRHLIREYRDAGEYSPIEDVDGRIKKISSILDKMQRKDIPMERMTEEIEDIAGIRIMCQFEDDIADVANLIRDRKDMKVLQEKDYITHPKSSGYRSFHMIVEYSVYTRTGTKTIPVEIQIRTLAMNFWATIEHSLQYKYRHKIPDQVTERLHRASEAIINLDNVMGEVRGEILDAQNSFRVKANIVSDILNNIQNMYAVANKREVEKIQDEFYKVYLEDDWDKLERYSKELDIIAEGYRAQGIDGNIES